jgi:hypothetical protein
MKIKMTALELIHHLADGSTTANTLQHISKIAKATLDEMKNREEMQPFIDMTNESYLRGVHDGRVAAQRQWVGLTDEEIESLDCVYLNWLDYEEVEIKGEKEFARAIEAKLKAKNSL